MDINEMLFGLKIDLRSLKVETIPAFKRNSDNFHLNKSCTFMLRELFWIWEKCYFQLQFHILVVKISR